MTPTWQKESHALAILSKGLRKDLDRHLPVQFGDGGAIDLTHAAGANLLADLVMGDRVG